MKKNLSILSVAVFLFVSCSKKTEVPAPAPNPVIGYWVGTYSYTNQIPKINYALLIKEGNVARIYDMDAKTDTSLVPDGAKVNGTWSLNENNIVITYKSASKTVTNILIIKEDFSKMNGTWAIEGVIKGPMTLLK